MTMQFRIAALAILAGALAGAQTAREMAALSVAQRGGAAAIQAVRSQRFTGRIWIGQEVGRLTVEIQRPSSIREELVSDRQRIVRVSNGRSGWIRVGDGEAKPLGPADIRTLSASADIEGPLIDTEAKGHRIEAAGAGQVLGRNTLKLLVHLKDGETRTVHLDAKTWLELKWEGRTMENGKEYTVETLFSDYRAVDGIQCAFRVDTVTVGTELRQRLIFDRIEINPDLHESRFGKP